MKKLFVILLFCFVSLSSIGVARAEAPFVYITCQQKEVNLKSYVIWDSIFPEVLTLKVNSNCFHGSVVASLSSVKNFAGQEINRDKVLIQTASTNGFVPMNGPVAISDPAFGSHDIVVDLKIKAVGLHERSGEYIGEIAFTIMPPV